MPSNLISNSTTHGRTYAGLSTEQRKLQRKQQFLKAALELFGTIGYRKATVRGICKQAKLTDRYFYESYSNLDALLMDIYEHCMTNLKSQILHTIKTEYSQNGAEKAIIAGIDCYFKELEDNRIARICMIELEGVSNEVNALYYRYINDFAMMLVGLTEQAFPNWSMDPKQKQVLAISLVGAMRQAATNWLLTEEKMDRQTLVFSTSQLFLGLLQTIQK